MDQNILLLKLPAWLAAIRKSDYLKNQWAIFCGIFIQTESQEDPRKNKNKTNIFNEINR